MKRFFEKVIKRILGRDNDITRTQIEQIIEPAFVKLREGAKQGVSGRVTEEVRRIPIITKAIKKLVKNDMVGMFTGHVRLRKDG